MSTNTMISMPFRWPTFAWLAAVAVLGVLPAPAHALSAMAMKALCSEPAKGSGKADEAVKQAAAGDTAFELRKDEAKAREAAAAYEASLAADANQPDVRIKLARVLYLLADGYYRLAEKEDEMLDAFERGMTHAGAALQQVNPAFRRKICSGAPIPEAIATLDRASVAPVYWFATHVGKYGLAKEEAELAVLLEYLPQQMSQDEILAAARQVIQKMGAQGPGDKGKVMARLMAQLKGKADGRQVSALGSELLGGS